MTDDEYYDPKTGNGRFRVEGYAQGGYIGPPPDGSDSVPFLLNRDCVLMTAASYRALAPDMREKLGDIELIFSAEEVRSFGAAVIERLQQELDKGAQE